MEKGKVIFDSEEELIDFLKSIAQDSHSAVYDSIGRATCYRTYISITLDKALSIAKENGWIKKDNLEAAKEHYQGDPLNSRKVSEYINELEKKVEELSK